MTPGGRVTFSGTATDDQALATVEVGLRNSTTRENLAADGTWGTDVHPGLAQDLSGQPEPGVVQLEVHDAGGPGARVATRFPVRATDKQDLHDLVEHAGSDQHQRGGARVTCRRTALLNVTGNQVIRRPGTWTWRARRPTTSASARVRVAILENDTDRYLRANGTLAAGFGTMNAVLASPGATSTTWTLPVDLPTNGDYSVTAYAVDTVEPAGPVDLGSDRAVRGLPG